MQSNSELFIQMQDELINTARLAEEGEMSKLDAVLYMSGYKKNLEEGLAIIKDFEDKNINEIAHEASQYPEGYKGFEIKEVSGRKKYSFKNVPEIEQAQSDVKKLEDKYKSAFDGVVKGTVQVVEDNETGVKYWVDADGCVNPLPELSIGKSYLLIKEKIK